MGSNQSKCESEENADNKNLMKLDSISTVSMAFTATNDCCIDTAAGTDDMIDLKQSSLCSCQLQRQRQRQLRHISQHHQLISNQSDVCDKSIIDHQRSKSLPPISQNSFVLDMDDIHHINHPVHHHHQQQHKSTNIDGDYGFSNLDSISPLSDKNNAGTSIVRKTNGRKSSSIILIAFFDTLIMLLMLALAIILRFTDEIKPIDTWFAKRMVCMFEPFYSWPYHLVSNTEGKLLFDNLSSDEFLFYVFVFIIPVVIITLMELIRILIRQIVHGDYDNYSETIIVPKINLSIPLSVRRICRILAGFILGLSACSIIADFIKLQTGQYRPYILDICPYFCHNLTTSNPTCWRTCNITDDIRIDVRKSMPSIVATLSSYSTIFLVYYITASLNYRATKVFRLLLSVIIIVFGILLSISRLTSYRNHIWDILAGWMISYPLAYYIVWYHLNGFSNRLSISNLFSAKSQCRGNCCMNNIHNALITSSANWPTFHIPRVQTSAKTNPNSNNESVARIPSFLKTNYSHNNQNVQAKQSSSSHSNAYINPAFSPDEHQNNQDNHHYHSSRIVLDSNNNQLGKRDGQNHRHQHQQQQQNRNRLQMRTFAN
ncbi:uncharacterized protein LOC113791789 isoform X1 [Dermatophagoides pteronyssinus]|uniref:uncharacterized protein LOC113791789 isoform X1 n=2 Tax=Dermatophagoides pteronyssinus TaxID=6956 RepID=UPI003F673BFE